MSESARLGVVAVAVVLALGCVPAMPRLVGTFGTADGEPASRSAPGPVIFLLATALVVGSTCYTLRVHLAWLPAYCWLGLVGVVLAAVDARVHRLPDAVVLPSYPVLAALFGVAALLDGSDARLVRCLLAGAAVWLGFATLYLLPGDGLGRGDVKLSGLLGAALGWLGWPHVVAGLVLGVLLAGMWALFLLATGRAGRGDRIAYGPHLLAGTWLAVLLAS